MHYHAEIVLTTQEERDEYVKAVGEIMEPFNEEGSIQGFWDWYQIGGRWTGAHDPAYSPDNDARNSQRCDLCNGTGFRNDSVGKAGRAADKSYTCNGCGEYDRENGKWKHGPLGPGVRVKWPTQWALFDGDVMSIAEAREKCPDLSSATLIVPPDKVCPTHYAYQQESWNGKAFVKTEFGGNVFEMLDKLGIKEGWLVTVDYHC